LKWEKGQTLAAKRLGVGVIGASRWANLAHLPGWARDERCQIIGICDVDPQRAGEAAHRYGAVAVHDYHDLLNRDDIDIIDVVTRSPATASTSRSILRSWSPVSMCSARNLSRWFTG
jgi:predicted dehydrogenase